MKKFAVALRVFFVAVLWWTFAVIVSLRIKDVLGSTAGQRPVFPYPFLFTALLNLGVFLWSFIVTRLLPILLYRARKLPYSSTGSQHLRLLPREVFVLLLIGSLQGVELALNNMSYQFLSLSMNRMVMACCVVFQLFTAIAWRLEEIRMLKWVAAVMLVLGGLIQGMPCAQVRTPLLAAICGTHPPASREQRDSLLGWVLVGASVLTSTNRWAFTQYIFQRSPPTSAIRRLTKFQLLLYMSIGTTAVCVLLASFFERRAFAQVAHIGDKITAIAARTSLCIVVVMVCELLIVSMTAATVMVILSVVHNIPIVLAGIVFCHDRVFRNQWIGFALCIAGAALYLLARNWDQSVLEADAEVVVEEQSLC
mmetsp:Transcript_112823/g.319041  ORF Transcript_112823/g.319041 Transcript_112823/m.319041 type:complete len:366 (+) Transcript_112823:125-1222(+)